MNDQIFTITFKTQAELEAAKATLQATQAVGNAAKAGVGPANELAKATGKLSQAQTESTGEAGKAASALTENAKVEDEAGETTAGLTVKKGLLLRSLKELRHEVPGLSEAMKLIQNPLIFIASLATLAVAALRRFTDAIDEQEQKLLAFDRITEKFGKFRSVTVQMRNDAASFAASLAAIEAAAGNAADKFERLNREIQRQSQLEAERRNKKEALELAQVDEKEQAGQISGSRAIQLRGDIKAKYDAEARRQERLKPLVESATLDKSIAQAQPELDNLNGQLAQAREAVKRAKSQQVVQGATLQPSKEEAQTKIGELTSEAKALENVAIDAGAGRDVSKGKYTLATKYNVPGSSLATNEAAQREATRVAAGLREDIKGWANTLDNIVGQETEASGKVDAANEKLSEIKTKITTYTRNIAEWRARMAQLMKDYEAGARDADQLEKLAAQQAALATRIQATAARKRENEVIANAVKTYVSTGQPMPPEAERLNKQHAQEDRPATASTVTPRHAVDLAMSGGPAPLRARPAGPPAAIHLATDQEREAAAGAAGSKWMMEQAHEERQAAWGEESKSVRSRAQRGGQLPQFLMPSGDGGQSTEAIQSIGAQIVQGLARNGQVTIQNFSAINAQIQRINGDLSALNGRLNQQQSRAEVSR